MVHPELNGGFIFDIQGFSLHDGPGCRTLIFLKGCSLHCEWCSNPEGIRPFPEPLYNPSKCLLDDLCIRACPSSAITRSGNVLEIDREPCRTCTGFYCAEACCSSALKKGGDFISTRELMRKINRDRQYWGASGGITLTGGEPFVQPEFTRDILKTCYDSLIHTAVETCGNVPWADIEMSLPWLEWIFYDLKHMDPDQHKAMTGSGNRRILANAKKLAQEFPGRLVFRMPVIPGYNDDPSHLKRMAEFIASTGKEEINLLPLHHLGREKHSLTGRAYYTQEYSVPSRIDLTGIQDLFTSTGITCYIGSDTPF
ncbi:MAG TPA: glycyl-radical enzyme activating protein [Bacteroidales bacterium]|nr:glycyl-radical enzyme activating protein [Bacteroidales bacterium]